MLGNAFSIGLRVFLAVFGLRVLLRRDWRAIVAAAALFTMMEGEVARTQELLMLFAIYMAVYIALIYLLLRWGLVATVTAIYFANAFNALDLGASWKTWYAPAGLATLMLLTAVAVLAFARSLGGRELLGENPT
jgi:hypothetical protein